MKPFNPKSTIFTNIMLDIIMPATPPNAWKIICYAMRKTAGWADSSTYSGRKESDVISISQFMKGCGIGSENTVMEAIDYCLEKGFLLREAEGKSFRYRLNVEYELTSSDIEVVNKLTSSDSEEVTSSDSEETNNNVFNNKRHLTSEESKQMTIESMNRGLARNIGEDEDRANQYPEDVRGVIKAVCELFNLKCPSIKSSHAGQWIKESRELMDACGEFGILVLEEIAKDFEIHMRSKNGTVPFPVAAPRSLVNTARAKAAELRTRESNKSKPYIPPIGAWIGGTQYEG